MSTLSSETPTSAPKTPTKQDLLNFLIETYPDQKTAQECFVGIKKRMDRNPDLSEQEIGRRIVNAMNERSGVTLRREFTEIYESLVENHGEKIREYGLEKWDHHIQALLCMPLPKPRRR